jgi:acyl-coenzyme A synthetase/AMP-(fatty) acid ligase
MGNSIVSDRISIPLRQAKRNTRSHNFTELHEYLQQSQVTFRVLTTAEHKIIEAEWRAMYGLAFHRRPRLRTGGRAEFEYSRQSCDSYLIIPFTSAVAGLPLDHLHFTRSEAYACQGPLVPLGRYHQKEFFITPTDYSWTMVHTHEDYGWAAPYFMLREWIN